uniref:Uncharacterized protein n=1 Tax=Picea sitchensis TaxID=3332 RepID=A9NQG4_PICSI|nr:unknown [Picea sitchensis]
MSLLICGGKGVGVGAEVGQESHPGQGQAPQDITGKGGILLICTRKSQNLLIALDAQGLCQRS